MFVLLTCIRYRSEYECRAITNEKTPPAAGLWRFESNHSFFRNPERASGCRHFSARSLSKESEVQGNQIEAEECGGITVPGHVIANTRKFLNKNRFPGIGMLGHCGNLACLITSARFSEWRGMSSADFSAIRHLSFRRQRDGLPDGLASPPRAGYVSANSLPGRGGYCVTYPTEWLVDDRRMVTSADAERNRDIYGRKKGN